MEHIKTKISSIILGIAIGALVGFSHSPTAGIVISALLSAAVFAPSFLEHDDSYSRRERAYNHLPYFIFPFILFVFGGMYAKTHNYLLPPQTVVDFQNLTAVKISPEAARNAVLVRYAGTEKDTSSALPAQSLTFEIDIVKQMSFNVSQLHGSILANTSILTPQIKLPVPHVRVFSEQILSNVRQILVDKFDDETALVWYGIARLPFDERADFISQKSSEDPDAISLLRGYY